MSSPVREPYDRAASLPVVGTQVAPPRSSGRAFPVQRGVGHGEPRSGVVVNEQNARWKGRQG